MTHFLPETLNEDYTVKHLIIANHHNAVFELESKKDHRKFVLKILSKNYYYNTLYSRIFSLQKNFLLLPSTTFYDSDFAYFVFPYCKTLSYEIATNGLSYPSIKKLTQDIGHAISTLHQAGILHLDIAPQNIYIGKHHYFYLGDFSSSTLKNQNYFRSFYSSHRYLRTGQTPAFAPSQTISLHSLSFWYDQYSFCVLLYILLNNGNHPLEEHTQENEQFSNVNQILLKAMEPLQSKSSSIDTLLLELEETFTLCDEQPDCQNYILKSNENTKILLENTTPDISSQKRKENKSLFPIYKEHFKYLSIPVPFYGLLILSGFIFLLSLYHFWGTKKVNNNLAKKNIEFTAITSSPSAINNSSFATNVPIKKPFPTAKNFSEDSVKPAQNNTSYSSKTMLDISNHSYKDYSSFAKKKDLSLVKILFANNNLFQNCKTFCTISSLEELYLSDNCISSLTGITKLKRLKILVLSKNNLHDVSELSKVTLLTTLDLSHNTQLENIHTLSNLTKLQYLILTNTNVTKKEIKQLQKALPLCTILS